MKTHNFIFSGYTLNEELYNKIMKYNTDSNLKKMICEGAYYICGTITVKYDHLEYAIVYTLLDQLDKLDLNVNNE